MANIIVVLDNIRSALNVGAIMRTCDGAGVQKIYLCGITPYPPHPKVKKTALGADEYVQFEHSQDILSIITKYKDKHYLIMSVEQTKKSKSIFEVKLIESKQDVVLIFGNEITGVSPEVISESDICVDIPMYGKKNSLNVATSVGIVLYHIKYLQTENAKKDFV